MANADDLPPVLAAFDLPARSLPVPQSISPQARAVLAAAARQHMEWRDYPAQDDVESWQQYAAKADANMLAMMAGLVENLPPHSSALITAGKASAYRVAPGEGHAELRPVLFNIHGGALIAGGGRLCELGAIAQAHAKQAIVYAPDYRMPPSHPFPAALDDCLTIYAEVVERHGPEAVVVLGQSAGGNLAAALMLRAKEEGLPLPAALVLETPEIDLTESGDSFQTNAVIDCVLQRSLAPINRLYAAGVDLAHPLLSPLFGDLTGFPPTLLTAGTRDMFLSNAVRMHHALRDADVASTLHVYEAMPHGGFFGTPDDARVAADIRAFVDQAWGR